MDKVLIIDDEKWVSEVIKMLIPWEDYGFTIARCCANGQEALEAVREEEPRLVFTDIRMPGMDGIEFLKEVSEANPELLCVVISGYNDFEYAKGALTYGAIGYLLKPIDEDELTQIVKKARLLINDRDKKTNESKKFREQYESSMEQLRNAYFEKVISGKVSPDMEYINYELKHNFKNTAFQMIIFSRTGEGKGNLADIISRALWKGQLPSLCYDVSIIEYRNKVVSLFNYEPAPDGAFPDTRDAMIRQIVYNNTGMFAYVGEVFGSISELKDEYEKLNKIELIRLLRENKNIFYLEQYKGYGRGPELLSPGFSYELVRLVSAGERVRLVRTVNSNLDMIIKLAGTNPVALKSGVSEMIYAMLAVGGPEGTEPDDLLAGVSDISDIRKITENLADRILLSRVNEQSERSRSVTERVVDYINTGYMNNISLTDVSEKYNLNPNYLSDIFSKNIGVTFKEYLTNTRMNAAKDLLKDTNYKIAEVAQMVGYNDVKNFSRIFKKYVGINPVEYRNLMGR